MKQNNIKFSSIISGLLFLGAGILLFAFNAGLLPFVYKQIIFSWQMLLIAIGLVCFFSRDKKIGGVILMLVGGFFLLPKLMIAGFHFVPQNGWALGLIIVGIIVIWNSTGRRKDWFWSDDGWLRHNKLKINKLKLNDRESGYIDINRVFSGSKERIDYKNFKGGEINSVFGGLELDLSEAQLAEGTNYLELNSVFGGTVLYIPIDWKIELRQTQVFGSFVDNRPKPGFEVDENRLLIIEANAVFGGGEIKCM